MKYVLPYSIAICLMVPLFTCANNGDVKDGVRRGLYNGANQILETEHSDGPSSPDKEPLSYEAYQRERNALLSGQKSD